MNTQTRPLASRRSFRASGLTAAVFAAVAGASACASSAKADTINLGMTIRDLTPSTNPDFQYVIANDKGLVAPTLGADGTPTYIGPISGTVTTHGPDTFFSWYHDVPGTNMTTTIPITLDNGQPGPGGVYTYSNTSFFPIDNQLLGNYGNSGHNYHFTAQMHAQFTQQPGLTFSFTGDDDVWVFINKQLVIDLGGVHGAQSASVNLDTLGLTTGQVYDFDFFFAERHTTESNLTISTSIVLVPTPGVAALAALGVPMITRRRKR